MAVYNPTNYSFKDRAISATVYRTLGDGPKENEGTQTRIFVKIPTFAELGNVSNNYAKAVKEALEELGFKENIKMSSGITEMLLTESYPETLSKMPCEKICDNYKKAMDKLSASIPDMTFWADLLKKNIPNPENFYSNPENILKEEKTLYNKAVEKWLMQAFAPFSAPFLIGEFSQSNDNATKASVWKTYANKIFNSTEVSSLSKQNILAVQMHNDFSLFKIKFRGEKIEIGKLKDENKLSLYMDSHIINVDWDTNKRIFDYLSSKIEVDKENKLNSSLKLSKTTFSSKETGQSMNKCPYGTNSAWQKRTVFTGKIVGKDKTIPVDNIAKYVYHLLLEFYDKDSINVMNLPDFDRNKIADNEKALIKSWATEIKEAQKIAQIKEKKNVSGVEIDNKPKFNMTPRVDIIYPSGNLFICLSKEVLDKGGAGSRKKLIEGLKNIAENETDGRYTYYSGSTESSPYLGIFLNKTDTTDKIKMEDGILANKTANRISKVIKEDIAVNLNIKGLIPKTFDPLTVVIYEDYIKKEQATGQQGTKWIDKKCVAVKIPNILDAFDIPEDEEKCAELPSSIIALAGVYKYFQTNNDIGRNKIKQIHSNHSNTFFGKEIVVPKVEIKDAEGNIDIKATETEINRLYNVEKQKVLSIINDVLNDINSLKIGMHGLTKENSLPVAIGNQSLESAMKQSGDIEKNIENWKKTDGKSWSTEATQIQDVLDCHEDNLVDLIQ